eukprot:6187517-Pleurochrysis_carterae.AAC.5
MKELIAAHGRKTRLHACYNKKCETWFALKPRNLRFAAVAINVIWSDEKILCARTLATCVNRPVSLLHLHRLVAYFVGIKSNIPQHNYSIDLSTAMDDEGGTSTCVTCSSIHGAKKALAHGNGYDISLFCAFTLGTKPYRVISLKQLLEHTFFRQRHSSITGIIRTARGEGREVGGACPSASTGCGCSQMLSTRCPPTDR